MSQGPSCEESLELIYDFLDGELPDATCEELAGHLDRCRACYPHFNFERLFLDRLALVSEAAESCPELGERILAMLDAETT